MVYGTAFLNRVSNFSQLSALNNNQSPNSPNSWIRQPSPPPDQMLRAAQNIGQTIAPHIPRWLQTVLANPNNPLYRLGHAIGVYMRTGDFAQFLSQPVVQATLLSVGGAASLSLPPHMVLSLLINQFMYGGQRNQ